MQLALDFKPQLDIPFSFFVLYENNQTTCQRMPKGTNYFRGKTSLLCSLQRNTLNYNFFHRNAKIDKGERQGYFLALDFSRKDLEALQDLKKDYVWYEVHCKKNGLGLAFVKKQEIYKLYNSKKYTGTINKKVENLIFLWQELENDASIEYELENGLYRWGTPQELDYLIRGVVA